MIPARVGRVSFAQTCRPVPRPPLPPSQLTHFSSLIRWCLRLFSVLVVCGLNLHPAFGQSKAFRASGYLRFSQKGLNDGRTNVFQFSFTFDRCRWFAQVLPIDGGGRAVEYGYDGARVWALLGSVDGVVQDNEPLGASVTMGSAPFEAPYHLVPVLWAAFGQSCYLDSLERNAELVAPSMDSPDRKFPALITRAAHGLRLPLDIAYNDRGIDPIRNVRRPPPFDKGYRIAEYRTLKKYSDSKIGDLPEEFLYYVFSPRYDAKTTNELHFLKTYTGAVTNFQTTQITLTGTLPRLPQGQPVDMYDIRFGNSGKPISYMMTNAWLSDDALRLTTDFQKWIEGSPQYSTTMPRRRWSYMTAITLITLAFLGAYGALRQQKQRKAN